MEAFAEYKGRKIKLKPHYYKENQATFELPNELSDVGQFIVYAVDRDGNKSEPKTLFTLEGTLLEKSPTLR